MRLHLEAFLIAAALLAGTIAAGAQPAAPDPGAGPSAGAGAPLAAPAQDPQVNRDRLPDLAQPDFTLVGLPTTLRLPRGRYAFRVTHRFTRPLGAGDFGSLLEDFFGIDAGALIGLELRYGLWHGTQVGIHRTSDRTIQFFGQYDVIAQNDTRPLGLDAIVTVQGHDNFRDTYSTGLGAIVSHKFGVRGAVYAQPIWVANTNPIEGAADDSTLILGFGARVRVRPTVYLVGEIAPRVGFDPGTTYGSFAIEKRVGGHAFQLNFSNSFATTLAQMARGGFSSDDWYIGFNISRKFY